jgi:hypothetical protein
MGKRLGDGFTQCLGFCLLVCLGLAVSCGQENAPNVSQVPPPAPDDDALNCVDLDHDGFGRGCKLGADCDDRDKNRNLSCGVREACTSGGAQPCYELKSVTKDALHCVAGTRSCANGTWTSCNMEKEFSLDVPDVYAGIVTGPIECNPCNPACVLSTDYPTDIDLNAGNSEDVYYDPGEGGITVAPDGGGGGGGSLTDGDGDGVPDDYDSCPANPSCDGWSDDPVTCATCAVLGDIFHVLPLGGPTVFDPVDFETRIRTADIYFLMDTTDSMQGEINNLTSGLTEGNFLLHPEYCGQMGGTLSQWTAQYYPNNSFAGAPAFTRSEGDIAWDWRANGPSDPSYPVISTDPSFPSDDFSVRWTATFNADGGDYDINISYDDAMRVKIDGVTRLGNLTDSGAEKQASTMVAGLAPGNHTIVVEYIEKLDFATAYFSISKKAIEINAAYTGIIGAIRCEMSDAQFGVGYHDDFPHGEGASSYGQTCGATTTPAAPHDVPYWNLQSITDNQSAIESAIDKLIASCGADTPESQVAALYSIATGNGVADTKTTLALGTIPHVEVPQVDLTVSATNISIPPAAPTAITHWPNPMPATVATAGGEIISSATALGNVNVTPKHVSGSYNGFAATLNYGCNANGRDIVYSFTVNAPATIGARVTSSTRKSSVAIVTGAGVTLACNTDARGVNTSGTAISAVPGITYYVVLDQNGDTGNGTFALYVGPALGENQQSAYDLGNLVAPRRLTGTTTYQMSSDYSLGCSAHSWAPEAVFKFSIASPQTVRFHTTGTTFNPALAVLDNTWTSLGCTNGTSGAPASRTYELAAGTYYVVLDGNGGQNEHGAYELNIVPVLYDTIAGAYNAGTITTTAKRFTGDTLQQSNIFPAGFGCSNSDAPDTVFRFEVTQRGAYSVSTEGSSFDSVVMLLDSGGTLLRCDGPAAEPESALSEILDPGVYYAVVDGDILADDGAFQMTIGPGIAASFETAYDLGVRTGSWVEVQGTTETLANADGDSGCFPEGSHPGRDAWYRFDVDVPTEMGIFTINGFDNAITLMILDSAGNNIMCDDGRGPEATVLGNFEPGTYYIRMDSNDPNAKGSFQLFVGPWKTLPMDAGATRWYANPAPACPAGKWGYPCFREESIPIVMLFTDAAMHSGPSGTGTTQYVHQTQSYWGAARALQEAGIKVIGIHSGTASTVECDFPCLSGHIENVCGNRTVCVTPICTNIQRCKQGKCWNVYKCGVCPGGPTTTAWTCEDEYVCDSYGPVEVCEDVPERSEEHLQVVASDTGAVSDYGPLVYQVGSDGSLLDSKVVRAVSDLAGSSRMNITLQINDDPGTVGIDESQFVSSIMASPTAETTARCVAAHGDWFEGCLPGTQARFTLGFDNNIVAEAAAAQVFDFTVDTLGDGVYLLSTTSVRIVVPPSSSAGVYLPEGRYWRTYDATNGCVGTERPVWGDLTWTAAFPPQTSILWEIRTSNDSATLDATTPETFIAPTTSSPVDIGQLLEDAGISNRMPLMKVTAVLRSNPAGSVTPALSGFELEYECRVAE